MQWVIPDLLYFVSSAAAYRGLRIGVMEWRRTGWHCRNKMEILHHKGLGGFTILEVLAILFIGAVLAIVLMPYLARPRGCKAVKLNCTNNQKQIGVAFLTWALDNHEKFPMQVAVANGGTMELVRTKVVFPHFEVMSNELSTPRILFCPEDSNSQ